MLNELPIFVNQIINNYKIICDYELSISLIVCSINENIENKTLLKNNNDINKLLYIKLIDDSNLFPKIEHIIEKNKLIDTLIQYITMSSDELQHLCGNTSVIQYRIDIANILYDLCIKN